MAQRAKRQYPEDVLHEQRLPGLGHVGRGGGALGDGPRGDEPGPPLLDSRWREHTQALARRKDMLWRLSRPVARDRLLDVR